MAGVSGRLESSPAITGEHESGLADGPEDDAMNVGTAHTEGSVQSTIWLTLRSAATRAAVSEATIKREAR